MGGHVLTHNKVLIFARTPVNINVSMSTSPKLVLLPASRYKSDIKYSYVNVCAKLHYD